jgi:hypothetical protein
VSFLLASAIFVKCNELERSDEMFRDESNAAPKLGADGGVV